MTRPPGPASLAEQLQRANAALPPGLRISYRPRGPFGRAHPYCVVAGGEPVMGASSVPAAIFMALRLGGRLPLGHPQPRTARHG